MLTEKELAEIAKKTAWDIFGIEYLRNNRKGSCLAHGYSGDDEYMLFVGIKDSHDLPDHEASPKGWTVYAEIRINTNTGEIIKKEYMLE